MQTYFWLYGVAIFFSSFFLTALLRKYALARSIMDIPNDRSSHNVPTPRGGGVAIVLTFLAALGWMASGTLISSGFVISLAGAGAVVAIIGFLDDHGHIPARWRLIGHFLSALWALWWLGGMPSITLFNFTFSLGVFGYVFGALYLVWMLNLFNFMDGIDGIASIQALCTCLGGVGLYYIVGSSASAVACAALAIAVIGFLVWNFPPARIFMGDAGSGFLGIVLGILSLQAAWISSSMFWGWLILMGVFIVDATFTLIRRLARGDKVYEAHRSHAYQYASRRYRSHRRVTLTVLAINVLWLAPLAFICVIYDIDGLSITALAYLPLVFLAVKFHAGELEKNV
ncbi:Undecaprenyl-phosphate alpha-N-acetylglucosaminyl 1-phosphate transferase [Pseudomonas sp. R1-43-08]|uniref:MraY family glycosyltransferase n=1 Tax=Pseudomonas sp. R1-43-08 TaxID=1173270 RepID=UPI000F587A24|nr:glycosyltransferase family 4 protein [Pseudomonas sp. R1-43-08]AZF41734.1 Undecaprenyl-phosphate alpha-N-acetylglucosaminyl 1-phosphate transferase [Pseudomonas sp. R1-43-08]